MGLIISPAILKKIGSVDHGEITEKEVLECFLNHCGGYCYDKRPEHLDSKGNPTPWFVAETNHGRCLKIMFVREDGNIYLKSAYPATQQVQAIFKKYAN